MASELGDSGKGNACMAGTTHPGSGGSPENRAPNAAPAPAGSHGAPAATPEPTARPPVAGSGTSASQRTEPHHVSARPHPWRRLALIVIVLGGLAYAGYALAPAVRTALDTV